MNRVTDKLTVVGEGLYFQEHKYLKMAQDSEPDSTIGSDPSNNFLRV